MQRFEIDPVCVVEGPRRFTMTPMPSNIVRRTPDSRSLGSSNDAFQPKARWFALVLRVRRVDGERLPRTAREEPGDVVGEPVDVALRAGAPGLAVERPVVEAEVEEPLAFRDVELRGIRRHRRRGLDDGFSGGGAGDLVLVEIDHRDVACRVVRHERIARRRRRALGMRLVRDGDADGVLPDLRRIARDGPEIDERDVGGRRPRRGGRWAPYRWS